MNLSEFKSKELIAQYGVTIPEGRIAWTPEEAEVQSRSIKAEKYVVKAQISAGGRGLAGGIKFAATPSSVRAEAKNLIGKNLVTEQTGATGEMIHAVYVEAAQDIEKDFFVALTLDPQTAQPTLIASTRGGVDFEQSARMDPNVVKSIPLGGDAKQDKTALTKFLNLLNFPEVSAACNMILSAKRAFLENDMTLLEINPFAFTTDGDWIAIDAKVSLDGNAMFRHAELETLANDQHIPADERTAQESNINLVKLSGNIGVVVNGAGLGLATNDMLIDAGGDPANFMDIRTTATSFDIAKGVELLLNDPNVKIILVNVHGGGMTVCDTVAEGIAFAYSRSKRSLPIAARFAGQNAEWGMRILKDRKLPVEDCADMTTAVKRAVALAKGDK